VAALENEFDMDVSDEELQDVRTFGDIVDFVGSKLA
jgi:acyl carrier protein